MTDREFDSAFHRIHVADNDGVRIMRFERNHQSSMRLDDPFATTIDYVAYMHVALAVNPRAARALVIGLGGGTLSKQLWRDYPWMRVDTVEIDPEVAEVARAYFALPDDERFRVIVEDGRAFVRLVQDPYDLIFVDAFDDDRVPRPLTTDEFMRECRDALTPGGVVAMNIIGAPFGPHSKLFRSLYRTVANVWRNVWFFPLGGRPEDVADKTRNIVLLATDSELTADELLLRISERANGVIRVPGFEAFGEQLHHGAVRCGDVPLITDPRPAGPRRR